MYSQREVSKIRKLYSVMRGVEVSSTTTVLRLRCSQSSFQFVFTEQAGIHRTALAAEKVL